MLRICSGMVVKRPQVLTLVLIVWLKLTYGIIDDDEYNSIYNLQMQEQQNNELGRFPFLMPNVRPKTVSLCKKKPVHFYTNRISIYSNKAYIKNSYTHVNIKNLTGGSFFYSYTQSFFFC